MSYCQIKGNVFQECFLGNGVVLHNDTQCECFHEQMKSENKTFINCTVYTSDLCLSFFLEFH